MATKSTSESQARPPHSTQKVVPMLVLKIAEKGCFIECPRGPRNREKRGVFCTAVRENRKKGYFRRISENHYSDVRPQNYHRNIADPPELILDFTKPHPTFNFTLSELRKATNFCYYANKNGTVNMRAYLGILFCVSSACNHACMVVEFADRHNNGHEKERILRWYACNAYMLNSPTVIKMIRINPHFGSYFPVISILPRYPGPRYWDS